MVTKAQALAASHGEELHFGSCVRTVGPRGGVKVHRVKVRVAGRCQTWKTRPAEFRLPVKHGLYESGSITEWNAADYHAAADCPLNQEAK